MSIVDDGVHNQSIICLQIRGWYYCDTRINRLRTVNDYRDFTGDLEESQASTVPIVLCFQKRNTFWSYANSWCLMLMLVHLKLPVAIWSLLSEATMFPKIPFKLKTAMSSADSCIVSAALKTPPHLEIDRSQDIIIVRMNLSYFKGRTHCPASRKVKAWAYILGPDLESDNKWLLP